MQSRVDAQEKANLWIDMDNEALKKGLSIHHLGVAYGILCLVVLICLPKIYLNSSIYYYSRDINKLQTQSDLLKEENRRLQNELESLRYKHFN